MASIHAYLDNMLKERPQSISQEVGQFSLKNKLVTSLMNFECQPCGIFEGFSYHKEDEVIDPNIFAATVGLGERINKLVSSKFMGMVSSVSVIFDTGDTY